MRQQREAPARWVTVCITQASVWFCDFPGVADMFVVMWSGHIFAGAPGPSSNTAAMRSSSSELATMSLAAAAP